jgi:hypothetical protein
VSFLEIADERRITQAKQALGALDWDVEPDAYQRMKLPSEPPVDGLFRLIARRGLEPKLVSALFTVFPARPIERALIAYDVLRGSLLGTGDGELAAQLATELAPLEGIASEAAAVPRDHLAALIAAVRSDDASEIPSLAGLTSRRDLDEATREAVFAHARALARAHLPSLAIAFLQIMFERFAIPQALEMMVDFALDGDAIEAVPQIPGQDDRSMRLQTYLFVRASLAVYDLAGAEKLLAALRQHPGVRDSSEPSLLLVDAHLALMQGKRLDPAGEAVIKQIADAALGWRYAHAVADAAAMPGDPEGTAMRLDNYVSTFGNDARVWGQAAMLDDAKPALDKLLSRELRFGSHDPDVWRALSALSGVEAIGTEVDERTTEQLRAALATTRAAN